VEDPIVDWEILHSGEGRT